MIDALAKCLRRPYGYHAPFDSLKLTGIHVKSFKYRDDHFSTRNVVNNGITLNSVGITGQGFRESRQKVGS